MFSSLNAWWSKLTSSSTSTTTAAPNYVVAVAHLLGISEFEVFLAAYRHWYGNNGDAISIENSFSTYIFEGEIPFWTRHFCHRVLTLEKEGKLIAAQFRPDRVMVNRPPGTEKDYLIINTLVA